MRAPSYCTLPSCLGALPGRAPSIYTGNVIFTTAYIRASSQGAHLSDHPPSSSCTVGRCQGRRHEGGTSLRRQKLSPPSEPRFARVTLGFPSSRIDDPPRAVSRIASFSPSPLLDSPASRSDFDSKLALEFQDSRGSSIRLIFHGSTHGTSLPQIVGAISIYRILSSSFLITC